MSCPERSQKLSVSERLSHSVLPLSFQGLIEVLTSVHAQTLSKAEEEEPELTRKEVRMRFETFFS
jgi:hypothetical protein